MYQRILVPLDGSEHAEAVLPITIKLASINDAVITFLHVLEYPIEVYSNKDYSRFYPQSHGNPLLDDKMRAKKEAAFRKVKGYLESLASSIKASTSKVFIEIQEGPVVDAILKSIEKFEIDLIIMSTIGNDCNPWMMGAIANRVLREAHVPVILMRIKPFSSGTNGFSNLERIPFGGYIGSQNEYSR